MGRLIRFVIYLACLTFIAVVAYAYVGPWFGVDFSAPKTEIREPVVLDVD